MNGEHFQRTGWWWSVKPFESRIGYYVTIHHRESAGSFGTTWGPNGGSFMCLGTRKRAIRFGERKVRSRQRVDARRARLSRTMT